MTETARTEEASGLLAGAIARPVAVVVAVILIVLAGLVALARLPIQLTPEVSAPTLRVTTSWPGAGPLEVERDLLQAQEQALESVAGLRRMEGDARAGRGQLSLTFDAGADLEVALVRVSNALTAVPDRPLGADAPVVETAAKGGQPTSIVIIRGAAGEAVEGQRRWVERAVVPRFQRISGVAAVELAGGREPVLHIDFDLGALAARGVSIEAVAEALGEHLRDMPGGDLAVGKRRILVRTPLAPAEAAGFESIVIARRGGRAITLGEVARARLGLRKPEGVALAGRSPAIGLILFAEAGANVLEISREIRALVDTLEDEAMLARGLHIEVFDDQVDYIEDSLELVVENLLMGIALAVLTLWLFLRSAGASALIGLSIPICVCGTAAGMAVFGRSINVVSLAGTAFAVGMVVDNSIVVLEAIEVWRERCASVAEAARCGVREVWGALVMNTATTAAVFIPMVAWQGEVADLLRDIAVALTVSVLVSLAVSTLIVPSLAARWLRPRDSGSTPKWGSKLGRRMRLAVVAQVLWLTARPGRSIVLVVAFVSAAFVSTVAVPAMEYLPTGDRNLVLGIIVPPPGYAVSELAAMGESFQAQMLGGESTRSRDGEQVPAVRRSFFVGDSSEVLCGASALDAGEAGALTRAYGKAVGELPDVQGFAVQASLFANRVGDGHAVELELRGADLDTLREAGTHVLEALGERHPELAARPIPSLERGAPELRVVPALQRSPDLEFGAAQLGRVMDSVVDGAVIGEWSPAGSAKVDVVLRGRVSGQSFGADEPETLLEPATLGAIPLADERGQVFPLASVAELESHIGPTQIRRIEGARAITLQIAPPPGEPLEKALAAVDNLVEELQVSGQIPASIGVHLAGTAGKLDAARGHVLRILVLAVLISYLLLAALFEDFLAPLAVLVVLPLAGAGGLMGLLVVDRTVAPQSLDMVTMVGFLILIGVVVNNAILVVDGALAGLRRGLALEEAAAEAVGARSRAICMSALTTLAALLPMVLTAGVGAELYRGIGAIVLGGLGVSTVLTLHVVPCVFVLLWRLRQSRPRRGTRRDRSNRGPLGEPGQ